MLKVTKVHPHKHESGKMLGFADIEMSLDGGDSRQMVWRGLKVFRGDDKIEISLPSKRDEKGKKDDRGKLLWHPVIQIPNFDDNPNPAGAELMEHIRGAIEEAYHSMKAEQGSSGNSNQVTGPDLPF